MAGHRSDFRSASQRAATLRGDAVAATAAPSNSARRRFSAAGVYKRGGRDLAATVCRRNGEQGAARAADERLRLGATYGWASAGPMADGGR